MTEAQVMAYAMSAVVILIGIVMIFVWVFMLRIKYRKEATDKETGLKKVRLEIIGKDGGERHAWGKIDSLVIRDETTGDSYPITNVQFVNSNYPEGGIFASQGVAVQKAIFIEGKDTSLVQKNYNAAPANIAAIVGKMRNEKFVAVATEVTEEFQAKLDKMKKDAISPVAFYMLFITTIVVAGVGAYFGYMITQKLAALGV